MCENKNQKWTLTVGVHRGTLMSRDAADVGEYDSLEECREEFNRCEHHYLSMGCQIWFARARGPNGESEIINSGTPYWK